MKIDNKVRQLLTLKELTEITVTFESPNEWGGKRAEQFVSAAGYQKQKHKLAILAKALGNLVYFLDFWSEVTPFETEGTTPVREQWLYHALRELREEIQYLENLKID